MNVSKRTYVALDVTTLCHSPMYLVENVRRSILHLQQTRQHVQINISCTYVCTKYCLMFVCLFVFLVKGREGEGATKAQKRNINVNVQWN
jgi:hypothetical protein